METTVMISFFKYSKTHVIRILRGPRNLFELHDYSNYRSSDYMSSTVYPKPFRKSYHQS